MGPIRIGITLILLMTGYVVLWSAQRGPSDPEAPVRMGRELFIRVWTVNDGLGPFMNARSCAGCHAVPRTGGSGTEERSFVSIVPVPQGALTRRVFQRLRVSNTGAIDAHAPPPFAVLRKAPSLFGSGLLEGITDDEIAAGVDELGTRGRVPQGRYGWKGQLRNIEDATAAAFANELGLTSPLFRESSESPPEISQQQIMAVAAFIRALQPLGRNAVSHDPDGQRWFTRMGCATCHRPSFRSLERWKAFPYTDLLLHDMGPALADGVEEGTATGNEFKTPPLWGVASTGPPYLHDGRAKTLHDAISAHGGEAEASADAYRRLNVVERASVLAFLRSL